MTPLECSATESYPWYTYYSRSPDTFQHCQPFSDLASRAAIDMDDANPCALRAVDHPNAEEAGVARLSQSEMLGGGAPYSLRSARLSLRRLACP